MENESTSLDTYHAYLQKSVESIICHAPTPCSCSLKRCGQWSPGGSCEPISVNTCRGSGVIHRQTSVPIIRPSGPELDAGFSTFQSQKKSLEGRRQIISHLKGRKHKQCKAYMKPFACAAYLPSCKRPGDSIPPCRDLCLKTKSKCQVSMDDLGFDWPIELECDVFPSSAENPHCISALNFGDVAVTTSDISVGVNMRVPCSYDLSPKMRPGWMIGDTVIEELSGPVRIDKTNSYTTTLVLENYVDSASRENYTCFVGEVSRKEFERQLSLDEIFGPAPTTRPPVEGAVRLISGYSVPHSGLVQYYKDGQWGYLCVPVEWDGDNANVICRQLGYGQALFSGTNLNDRRFGRGSGTMHVSASKCRGQEASLADCPDDSLEKTAGSYYCRDTVGVVCDTGSRETDIRLSNGTSPDEGILEVFYNNEWGTINNVGWDIFDAQVACRQLGYKGVKSISRSIAEPDYNYVRTMSVMLSGVACDGTEASLFDCLNLYFYNDPYGFSWDHDFDVILGCSKEDIDLKLSVTAEESEGGVDVRLICSTEDVITLVGERDTPVWTLPSGEMLFLADARRNMQVDGIGVSSSRLTITGFTDQENGGRYKCRVTGYEKNITLTEASIVVEGAVRLISGYSVPHSGLVQYHKDGQWGYLCPHWSWDMNEENGNVLCKQLGYGPSLAIVSHGQMFGTGNGVLHYVPSDCTGQEATLAECPNDSSASGCGFQKSVGVVCDTGSRETDIRLSNGTSPDEGVLEVYYNNEWGTVCNKGWDVKDAEVACRQLGYNGIKYLPSSMLGFRYFYERFTSVMFGDVDCDGTEASLFDCPKSNWYITHLSCAHDNDVILGCTEEINDLKLRNFTVVETVSGIDVSMICSAENVPRYAYEVETPVWTLPSGSILSAGEEEGNIRTSFIGSRSNNLLEITGFTDEQDAGIYLCTVTGYHKNVTLTEATIAVSELSEDQIPPRPSNLQVAPSHNSVTVSWTAPSDQSIMIRGYILGYGASLPDGMTVRLSASQFKYIITGLMPETLYVLKLRAFNRIGEGPSLYIDAMTSSVPAELSEDQIPPEPSNLQVAPSHNSVTVSWTAPSDQTVRIRGYILGYGAGVPDEMTVRLSASQFKYIITGLMPETLYVLKLRAFNHIGEGPSLYIDAMTSSVPVVEGAVRLISGYSVPHSGLVQYYKDGQWGYLCAPLIWDEDNADVVCKQLGYGPALFIASLGQMFGTGNGVLYVSGSKCTGQEATLAECAIDSWDIRAGCSHNSDVGVVCDTGSRETDIRLSNGTSPGEGVLEVYYNNEWGTVCNKGWDIKDAEVACRQLGYNGVKYLSSFTLAFDYNNDRFTSVMFGEVDCNGTEASLFDCPKSNWYIDDFSCSHYNDVILGCTKEDIDLKLKDFTVVETVSGIDVFLTCSTEDVLMYVGEAETPVWTLPSGSMLSVGDEEGNIRSSQIGVSSNMLEITGFTDERDAGIYLCTVTGYHKNITLTEATIAVSVDHPCAQDQFNCGERCVPQRFLCDQEEDCADGRDESEEICSQILPNECTEDKVPCDSATKCVSMSALCDGIPDCDDGLDEGNCDDSGPLPPSGCPIDQIACPFSGECIATSALCNGNPDCSDGMDEATCGNGGTFQSSPCPEGHTSCPLSDQCIPMSALCDGNPDCTNATDELGCEGIVPPDEASCPADQFPCPLQDKCISLSEVCNGVSDCSSGVDEMNCPDTTSCVPISVSECAVGLDYTETLLNYNIGLSTSDIATLFSSLSIIFESGCGTFFRPFMCSTFVPPCGQAFQPPCRELCQLAIRKCLETFEGEMTEEQLMPQGVGSGGCDALPSQEDSQCYNVKEVSIGEVIGSGSEAGESRYVDCTYNLLPSQQPKWTAPGGSKVKTGERRKVQAIYISERVTRLQINKFSSRYQGMYTCSGQEYSQTVML
ncbi:uncharacterized protein LOC110984704 isoform X3 [Acanthaster planci]|uniref:Uncharacterized protein LOC110984704 isoform X3 n=1 Tax=Acanthaster planci TaxID=133434 RepID=A0A8B7Z5B2_ACAPL|nr:uncharacterized protein LOC110984704 isoform X3 [Acanthaster planci]